MEYQKAFDFLAKRKIALGKKGDTLLFTERNPGALFAVIESAYGGYGDKEFYPTNSTKGASILYEIIAQHIFHDGNKRAGVIITILFLFESGEKIYNIEKLKKFLISTGLIIANGTFPNKESAISHIAPVIENCLK